VTIVVYPGRSIIEDVYVNGGVLTDAGFEPSSQLFLVTASPLEERLTISLAYADAGLTKEGTDNVLPGERVTYTLSVRNQGPSDVPGVVVTDTLPAPVSLIQLPGDCVEDTEGTVVCGPVDVVAGMTKTWTLVVEVGEDVEPGTRLLNQAVMGAETADPDVQHKDEAEALTTVMGEADLSLSKHGPPTATVGSKITYTIVVTNAGPSDAQDVQVLDHYPQDLKAVAPSASQGMCTVDPSVDSVTCTLGLVAARDEVVITIIGTLDSASTAATIENKASAGSTTEDPDGEGPTDIVTTTVAPEVDEKELAYLPVLLRNR
jgi:uncharacterized repeat protein (TIGR01451 family)